MKDTMMNKKYILTFIVFLLAMILLSPTVLAVCPVCTIAVGAGLGLSRYLGVDDVVTGIWIGGLMVSLIGWTINWLNKKNIKFYGRKILITVVYYALGVLPFVWTDIIGHPLNKMWGIDKLLLGVIFGTIGFVVATVSYEYLKKKNGGRAHFKFEKIVFPMAMLVILSLVFYFVSKA